MQFESGNCFWFVGTMVIDADKCTMLSFFRLYREKTKDTTTHRLQTFVMTETGALLKGLRYVAIYAANYPL